jgi:hypothetical protein
MQSILNGEEQQSPTLGIGMLFGQSSAERFFSAIWMLSVVEYGGGNIDLLKSGSC